MMFNVRIQVRLLLVGLVLAVVGSNRVARAQIDDDLVEENEQPVNAMAGLVQPGVNGDQIDQWVFGRFGGSGGARNKLDSSLSLRIDDLERTCGLTEFQKKKLRLAGRGDIKRFFDHVEDLKRKYAQGQNVAGANVWQEVQPLQVEINSGFFGDDSIYAKTIRRTLSGDQAARFESMMRERKLVRHRSTVEWFVVHLDKGLGLTDDQRRRFVDLLVSEARPPRRFGHGDYWYLMLQTAEVPEAKIKPIFDAPQWRLLSRQFIQARGMEQWLKANGILPDDEKDGEKAATLDAVPAIPLMRAATSKPSVR
jgi:hypothetical protein